MAAANLAAYYTFDEGSGTRVGDTSGKGNNGTASGNPQWVPGKIGGAMSFDGVDDLVDCGKGASLVIRDTLTVACWIKVASFATGNHPRDGRRLHRSRVGRRRPAIPSTSAVTGRRAKPGRETLVNTDAWRHVAEATITPTDHLIDGMDAVASTGGSTPALHLHQRELPADGP
jgi:hypothetical protein